MKHLEKDQGFKGMRKIPGLSHGAWALAFVLVLALVTQPSLADPRPNFLVVLVDDAGFMDFGAYGSEARTPNIDRLAAEGVKFYEDAPWFEDGRPADLRRTSIPRAFWSTS
jgi:hypothetical protein